MRLAVAGAINTDIANMLINRRFLEQEKVGEGNHSSREIGAALYLITALEYWFGHITGLAEDQNWVNDFEKHLSAHLTVPMLVAYQLIPQGANLSHLVKLEPKSDAFNIALTDRMAAWRANPDDDKQFISIDSWKSPTSFMKFLKTLPLRPSSEYWRRVYTGLSLEYPEYDPDRMDDKFIKTALIEKMAGFRRRSQKDRDERERDKERNIEFARLERERMREQEQEARKTQRFVILFLLALFVLFWLVGVLFPTR